MCTGYFARIRILFAGPEKIRSRYVCLGMVWYCRYLVWLEEGGVVLWRGRRGTLKMHVWYLKRLMWYSKRMVWNFEFIFLHRDTYFRLTDIVESAYQYFFHSLLNSIVSPFSCNDNSKEALFVDADGISYILSTHACMQLCWNLGNGTSKVWYFEEGGVIFWRRWCGSLKRMVWYFEESGVVFWRGWCDILKRVVWYFEECGLVLWRGYH